MARTGVLGASWKEEVVGVGGGGQNRINKTE